MAADTNEALTPRHVVDFAASALVLDLLYLVTSRFKQDLESIWILSYIIQESLYGPLGAAEKGAPASTNGTLSTYLISCRSIAEKTGLSRETVRRRVCKLVDEGLLNKSSTGQVWMDFSSGSYHSSTLNQVHDSVQRYIQRLQNHNVSMPLKNEAA